MKVTRREEAEVPRIDATDTDFEPDAYFAFADGFQRSRKGNLWRDGDGLTLTIFQRPDESPGEYRSWRTHSNARRRVHI
jgi:hypothetical protein